MHWARATVNIYEYNSPIVTIKQGIGKISNGNYKIIHTINLKEYEKVVADIKHIVHFETRKSGTLGLQMEHQLYKIENLLDQLRTNNRSKRSINWIGSAWKWIAGNPDATDWDTILNKTNDVLVNNNKQYTINEYLIKTTNTLLDDYNKVIAETNEGDTRRQSQTLFNKLGLIKDEIAQIVMACQLARTGIVHSQLLNKGDILNILSQTETLPYKNELQALQFAEPSMVIKDSLLLYIISLPQTEDMLFNNVILRSTVQHSKRIYLTFTNLLISQTEKYGVKEKCLVIDDVTICKQNQIQKLKSDHCIVGILEGRNVACEYQIEEQPITELISDGTVFLSNYIGKLTFGNSSKTLNGTFIVNFFNESITLNEISYTNWQTTSFQILPPILQNNITENRTRLDLQYLHHLHINNIKHIKDLSYKGLVSISSNFAILLIGFSILFTFFTYSQCRNRQGTLRIPPEISFPELKINYP